VAEEAGENRIPWAVSSTIKNEQIMSVGNIHKLEAQVSLYRSPDINMPS